MSRKKTAKRAVKRQAASTANATPKMEKDFQQTVAKAATQLNNEVTRAKQQIAKCKKAQGKANAGLKKIEARIKTAQKAKPSAANKKQIKMAAKQRSAALNAAKAIEKQMKDAEMALQNASNAQARLQALSKHIAQFDQIWAKTSKKLNKPKATAKAKRKPKAKKDLAVQESPVIQNIQPLHIADEAAELAS